MSVYTWGFGKLGQLGGGRTDTEHTPVVPKLPAKEIIFINCGGYYTAVITADGDMYTFGCGKYGRLGTGDEADRLEPEHVKASSDGGREIITMCKVSCGIWHGAAVTTDKNLCIWGYGKSHGVLGDSSIPSGSIPRTLNGPFARRVAGVSCGNNFTLLWTDDGETFSWGCGRFGVLGHGTCEDAHVPTIISELKDKGVKVVFMDAGFAHSGAISQEGRVFMFGKGEDGALGLGPKPPKLVLTPKILPILEGVQIKELSCSIGEKHGHTLFVSSEGHVYACGDGYKGKLGLGDQEPRWKPTQIPKESFSGERITHVSSGGIHSTAVSAEGHVFTWGCGSDGRLGHAEGQGHRYLFRSDTPRVVEELSKAGQATQVSCSYYHTAAIVKVASQKITKA